VQDLPSSSLLSTNIKIKIYKIIILPVVLFRCETWSLILREEHRLGMFENRVVRRILGPTRDKVTEEWGELNNEALHNLYSSPNIIQVIKSRRMRWGGACNMYGGWERCIQDFLGRPEGRRRLGRPRHRWEDNIKIDLQEVGWKGTDWIDMAEGRDRRQALVNAVMTLHVP
jgi:hypothetical protein